MYVVTIRKGRECVRMNVVAPDATKAQEWGYRQAEVLEWQADVIRVEVK